MSELAAFTVLPNPRHGVPRSAVLPEAGFRHAKATITAWSGYAPTPLVTLPEVADETGVDVVRMKDEGPRFGLGSFKALGGAYAVAGLLADRRARGETDPGRITVCCATDGNHGRSVAWGARRFGCRCVVFVHATVSTGRVEAIRRFGAEVVRVPGVYDDAVREAEQQARQHGWLVVSDTSYPGYTEVPRQVMQGYRLMADEAADQWDGMPPTHVFVQAGVGGAAAAVSVQLRNRFPPRPSRPSPSLVVVEPDRAACLMASARAGASTSVSGALDTIMAGLACGEPSVIAWQELRQAAAAFMTIPDDAAVGAMRLLARVGVAIGESGVAGLAGLRLAAAEPAARQTLGLDANSRVLLFGTEGVTDSKSYEAAMSMV